MDENNYLAHVGRSKRNGAPGRGSGRYPLGSGEEPYQDYHKDQLQRMAKSKDDDATKKELANQVNKSKTKIKAKTSKKDDKNFSASVRKRAEEFRKSRYKKKIEKEKAETKRYKEQIRLEKTRLDKEKAKEEAKRLSKMAAKDYNGDKATSEETKKSIQKKDYSIKAKPVSEMSNQDIEDYLTRLKKENDYNKVVNPKKRNEGREFVKEIMKDIAKDALTKQGKNLANKLLGEGVKQLTDSLEEKNKKNKKGKSNNQNNNQNNNQKNKSSSGLDVDTLNGVIKILVENEQRANRSDNSSENSKKEKHKK